MTQLVAEPTAAVDGYARDGVVMLRRLFAPEEIAEIARVFTKQVESDPRLGLVDQLPEDDILSRYPRIVHPHRHPEVEAGRIARRLMTDRRILDVVQDLIDPAYGAQSMFYFKPPTARGQALHQDNLFLQAHPETCLAAWIAVDDCDGENGGLIVLPGSHRIQILCPDEGRRPGRVLHGQDDPSARQRGACAASVTDVRGTTHSSLSQLGIRRRSDAVDSTTGVLREAKVHPKAAAPAEAGSAKSGGVSKIIRRA